MYFFELYVFGQILVIVSTIHVLLVTVTIVTKIYSAVPFFK